MLEQDFMPLGSRVHVHGIVGNSAEDIQHGRIASPICPYFDPASESNALGYLVQLDAPVRICGASEDQIGSAVILWCHYSSISYIGDSDGLAELIVEGDSEEMNGGIPNV